MKALLKLLFGTALAAAAVAYLTSPGGRDLWSRLTGYAREAADLAGATTFSRPGGAVGPSSGSVDDEALRDKIEETRRRLQDQLAAQPPGDSAAGGASGPGTAAGTEAA